MKILILHRIPYYKVEYHRGIDHSIHQVYYIGTQHSLEDIPTSLRCNKIERLGNEATHIEVEKYLLSSNERFDKIISLSEYELLDAAILRDKFDICGPRVDQIEKVRNKLIMKKCIEDAGLRVPHNLSLLKALEPDVVFKWSGKTILKPISGASSENVRLFGSPQDLVSTIKNRSSRTSLLDEYIGYEHEFEIEEYIPGVILHIDGLVKDQHLAVCTASEYVGTCLDYANGYPLASIQIELSTKLRNWTNKCLDAVSITDGSFHLELIIDNDELCFLEIGNRVGGADVVKTFEMLTGIHLPSAELACMLDSSIPIIPRQSNNKYGWFVFPGHHLSDGFSIAGEINEFSHHKLVYEWNQLAESQKLTKHITYQPHEVPISGIMHGRISELREFVAELFNKVKINAKNN